MSEENPMNEQEQSEVTWNELQTAFNTFTGGNTPSASDYAIVGHAELAKKIGFPTVFDSPNKWGIYTITGLGDYNEKTFLEKLNGEKPVVVVEGCMDKHNASVLYDLIREKYPDALIISLFYAGGAVQTEDREISRETIHAYLGSHAKNISHVYITDHDHVCGLVKVKTDNYLGRHDIQEKSRDEHNIMKSLIMHGQRQVAGFYSSEVSVIPALSIISRDQPHIELDTDFSSQKAFSIEALLSNER
jgi:hypothetical protein